MGRLEGVSSVSRQECTETEAVVVVVEVEVMLNT